MILSPEYQIRKKMFGAEDQANQFHYICLTPRTFSALGYERHETLTQHLS